MREFFRQYGSYFREIYYYFGSAIVVACIGILINPFLAKNLSPEDYAIIGYYTSFTTLLVPLLHFNLITYYLRNYYRLPEEKRQITSDTILLAMMGYGAIAVCIGTGIFYFFYMYMQVGFPFFPYAVLVFLQTYFSIFFTYYTVRLRIQRKARRFAFVTLLNSLLGVLFSILWVVLYKYGADGRLWALLVTSFLMAVYSFLKTFGKFEFDFQILKEALRFGAPLTLSALFWYFYTGIDRIFLEELGDIVQLGIYTVGMQMAAYLMFFYTALGNALEPDIYKAIAENNRKKLFLLIGGIVGSVGFINLLFIVVAPYVIDILTAGRYVQSTPFARILALQNITVVIFYMIVRLLIGYGYVKKELMMRVAGAVVSVVLFKVLISSFGFYGAAWGQVLSFLLLSMIGALFLFVKRKALI